MPRDYYAVLNLDRNAEADEIRKAYRRLALQYHPDVNPQEEAQERIREINHAYAVLSDPEKRRWYDLTGTADRVRPAAADAPGGHPFANMGRGRGCGRRGCGRGAWRSVFQQTRLHRVYREGDDCICTVPLHSEELQQGTRRTLIIRDTAGSTQIQITIPPGSRKGDRFVAAVQPGNQPGNIIVEVH